MSKHTPGPWRSYGGCIYAACQMNENGMTRQRPLAEVTSDQDHDDHYEENCSLIAAAPELLEACKGLLGIAERHGWLHVAVDAARAAIAKAEGGNP